MLNLYYNTYQPDSKCNWVMDSLKEGWPDSEYAAYTQTYYGYPAAYWGFINSNKNNILRHIDNGVDWWFWDMPFWGRWSRHTDREHYWHVAKNNIYPTLVHDCPSDRFDASGLKPKPYKSGEYIKLFITSNIENWILLDLKIFYKFYRKVIHLHKPYSNNKMIINDYKKIENESK